MAVFTTSVTINGAKLPDGSFIGLSAGRAEVTEGTAFGLVGRDISITATPATGYEFVNFIVEEENLRVSSVDVGFNAETIATVCDPQVNLGTTRKLYFTLSPTTGNPEPGVSLDPEGNQIAPEGFYAAGQSSGTPQYFRLSRGVLNGPLNCNIDDGGGTGGAGVAREVTLSPAGLSLRDPGDTGTFTITIKDATGRTLINKPVVWSSTNTNVATVDQTGRVTAGSTRGTTTIRASVKNATGLQTEAFADARVNVTIRE